MRSIIVLAILLAFVMPIMAMSPIEKAYMNGVNVGLSIGKLVDNIDQYNLAVQQFNDHVNQTYGANASQMWLPKIAVPSNANNISDISSISLKPIHKMDGTPAETTVIQY